MVDEETRSARNVSVPTRQFTLLSLLVVVTLCAIGFAIFSQPGGWSIFMICLAMPMLSFGIFCILDAVKHRQPGRIANAFIGVSLVGFATTVIVHTLVTAFHR